MAEHPIPFNGKMVRAILADEKTQTRQVIMPQPPEWVHELRVGVSGLWVGFDKNGQEQGYEVRCPYGEPGDTLWIKETFAIKYRLPLPPSLGDTYERYEPDTRHGVVYKADGVSIDSEGGEKWTPSIHMPRWASRIDLVKTDGRVERVQEISRRDALAEGVLTWRDSMTWEETVEKYGEARALALVGHPVECFAYMWNSIYTKPRPRIRDGAIAFYESFPWGGEKKTGEYRGKPWHIQPNPLVWVTEFERL